VGVVAGSSVLGMLIPPSLLLILFGVLTEKSIGDLFIAGIIPGIVLSLAYAVGIVLMATLRPSWVYANPGAEFAADDRPHMGMGEIVAKMFPIVLLIGLVLGGIYGGVFTPVEAGAVRRRCPRDRARQAPARPTDFGRCWSRPRTSPLRSVSSSSRRLIPHACHLGVTDLLRADRRYRLRLYRPARRSAGSVTSGPSSIELDR
jgi:hypothetical protein